MIVQKLKPWVTSFSEAIVKMCKHGDTVCVGGEIVEIFNMAEALHGIEDPILEAEAVDNAVYMTLDDGGRSYQVPLDDVVAARLVFEFGPASKPGGGSGTKKKRKS